ncbi:hypothetical protein OBBRIDRAFT_70136 [Obba rivulosa]|uniref:Zn(2)-C6 fungal-type domain-containing protein n=1 Tax=Obba rivulosa TaxID=1052685 RepID=A0A8E2DJ37_9APHY|nr:hypothetical protein OBBRIDRAFT_70136 [Obba rivulosa]
MPPPGPTCSMPATKNHPATLFLTSLTMPTSARLEPMGLRRRIPALITPRHRLRVPPGAAHPLPGKKRGIGTAHCRTCWGMVNQTCLQLSPRQTTKPSSPRAPTMSPYAAQANECYGPLYSGMPTNGTIHSPVAYVSPQSLPETMPQEHHMFDWPAFTSQGSEMRLMISPTNMVLPEQYSIQTWAPSRFAFMPREWDASTGVTMPPIVPQDYQRILRSVDSPAVSSTDASPLVATTHMAGLLQPTPMYPPGALGTSNNVLSSPKYSKRRRADTDLSDDEVQVTKRERLMSSMQHQFWSFPSERARHGEEQALSGPLGTVETAPTSSKDVGTPRACTMCRQNKTNCMKTGEKCLWCQTHGAECVEAHSDRRPTAGSINRHACTACRVSKKKCTKIPGGCTGCTRRNIMCSYPGSPEASNGRGDLADPSNPAQGGTGNQGSPAAPQRDVYARYI